MSALVAAISGRYARSRRDEKARILDEFVAVTGFHRKHAMRLLRSGGPAGGAGPRPGRRVYDEAVRTALLVVWEASDRVCGKRLRAIAAGAGRGDGAARTPCSSMPRCAGVCWR